MLVSRSLSQKERVTASCGVGDAVGDVVYVSGAKSGADYSVTKTDPTAYASMPGLGIVIYKISATRCVVQLSGEVLGLYTGLTPGRVCWVGLDSRPTQTPPAAPISGRAYLNALGIATSTDILLLRPTDDMKVRVN